MNEELNEVRKLTDIEKDNIRRDIIQNKDHDYSHLVNRDALSSVREKLELDGEDALRKQAGDFSPSPGLPLTKPSPERGR